MWWIVGVPIMFWVVFIYHFNDYNDSWQKGLLLIGLVCTGGFITGFLLQNPLYILFLCLLIICAIAAFLRLQLYGFWI